MPRNRSRSRSPRGRTRHGGQPVKRGPVTKRGKAAKSAKSNKPAKQSKSSEPSMMSREKRLEIIQENILRTTSAMINAMQRNDTTAADRAIAEGENATQLYNAVYALPKNTTWPTDQRLP